MLITIQQVSDLFAGNIVSRRRYEADDPTEIQNMFTAVLEACEDLLDSEGIAMDDDTLQLVKVTFKYPGVAGGLEVLFGPNSSSEGISVRPTINHYKE